ncbi:MAG: acetate kinase [Bowdeniella nasicola]|nr:acetate kinase [Bowdeniella nasicola]
MQQTVLVINSGSSSIKYQLVDPADGTAVASGLVERIGEGTSLLRHRAANVEVEEDTPIRDHAKGLRRVLELFAKHGPNLRESNVVAVGHRVVQGGAFFDRATVIDPEVFRTIEALVPLAPLHNPAHLRGIEVAQELLPDVPHVAVFDTAFFQSLPAASATYALDREVARKYAIRRYGAHGTSHQFVSRTVAEYLGRMDARQIVLHLGNGASASAVVNGRAVDTSMGLTPLEGLVMGTRSGDIDPAAIFHLARNANMSIEAIDNLLNKRSGMKGMTGQNDLRVIHTMAEAGDRNARVALAVYAHRIKKYIGAYAAVLGGVDVITFTAGVGENDAVMRELATEGLEFLGVKIDHSRNRTRTSGIREISRDSSKVKVLVVPTNEEWEIARQAVEAI